MAISRPFLLALVGALLVGATFFAVQSARERSDGDAAPASQPAAQQPATSAPSEPSGTSAQEALAAAFAGDQKIESGRFSVRLAAEDFEGAPQLDGASIEVAGRFQGHGPKAMPEFDIDMTIAAAGERAELGAVSLGDSGFVTQGDKAYAVPETVMSGLTDARAQIAEYADEPQPKLSVAGFDLAGWLADPKVAGTERMDGVEVTHVEANLDPARFVDGVVQLSGQGSGIPQGEYLKQVARNRAAIEDVLGRPEVDVYVGDDGILRRLRVEADLDLPASVSRQAGGAEAGTVVLDATLSDVNEPQRISAPGDSTGAPPQGTDAINAAGMMSLGALMIQQPGLAGARAGDFSFAELSTDSAPLTDNPQKAARAVKAGKKVVLLFRNPRGLDDRAVTRAVDEVARRTNVLALTDDVQAADRYGKLVEDLGVSQTPSIVIIDRAGQARLIEGYLDTQTLAQAVADAR